MLGKRRLGERTAPRRAPGSRDGGRGTPATPGRREIGAVGNGTVRVGALVPGWAAGESVGGTEASSSCVPALDGGAKGTPRARDVAAGRVRRLVNVRVAGLVVRGVNGSPGRRGGCGGEAVRGCPPGADDGDSCGRGGVKLSCAIPTASLAVGLPEWRVQRSKPRAAHLLRPDVAPISCAATHQHIWVLGCLP